MLGDHLYGDPCLQWGKSRGKGRFVMLVIVMGEQILPPRQVCQACLLADHSGQPRWHHGKLRCGHAIHKLDQAQPDQYECEMGFRIANIE